jgi:hypothetical protein
MILASSSPVRHFGRASSARCFPTSVWAKPNSTSRWRIFSTVFVRHPNASAMRASVEALPRIAMASFRDAQSGSGKKLKWTLHILEREAQSSGASCCDRSEATQVEGKAGGRDPLGRTATASCALRRICWTCRPKSLRCCTTIAGQSRFSYAFSSIC